MSDTPQTDQAEASALEVGQWHLAKLSRQLERENTALKEWKESALSLHAELNEQALAKMLGGQLGRSCRKIIAERVPELIAENAALREALERADLALGNLGIGSAAPVRVIARNALRKEAQPCPHCTNGIVRSLGMDNDEVIEDCPHCSREQRKEAQP